MSDYIPTFNGQPIAPGWWWLRFEGGPEPRCWNGKGWVRDKYYWALYIGVPVIAPCVPPDGGAQ